MFSLIFLLLIIAVVISRIVNKKLTEAGQTDIPYMSEETSQSEMMSESGNKNHEEDMAQMSEEKLAEHDVPESEVRKEARPSAGKNKEELRKMVIYSEIFKAKYQE